MKFLCFCAEPVKPSTGVTVTASTTNSISLTYSAVSNDNGVVSEYIFYLEYTKASTTLKKVFPVVVRNPAVYTATFNNLHPFTTYSIRYSAVNGAGEGPASDAVTRQLAAISKCEKLRDVLSEYI